MPLDRDKLALELRSVIYPLVSGPVDRHGIWYPLADFLIGKLETPTPDEHQKRKDQPVTRGVLDYFPDALLEVAELSRVGNEQHNPGEPLHWAYGKSMDHADCIVRHLIDRKTRDKDGLRHTAKVAWRALALLQTELEEQDKELHERRQAQRNAAAKGAR